MEGLHGEISFVQMKDCHLATGMYFLNLGKHLEAKLSALLPLEADWTHLNFEFRILDSH